MEKTTATSILNDKTKIGKLTEYLLKSLEAQKQGNPKNINDIFDQLLNENIEVDFIKLWLSIFCKMLIDSVSQPNLDCSTIIDFILYKSKWLTSMPKHLQAFESYQKFCVTLISIKNSYLPLIMKLLVQNLVPQEMYDEGPRSQNLAIKIGNTTFQSLTDLKQFVVSIIKNPKYELSALNQTLELSPEHSKFMYDLLSYHPKAQQKLKNVSKILVGVHQIGTKLTRCFFIEKNSSHKEDISYLKACDAAYDAAAEQGSQYLLNDSQKLLGENILNFLARLFKLYPLSLNHLSPILKEVFPHRRLDEDIQRVFLLNILKLTIKFEKIRTLVLDVCLEKLLQIDVEIKHSEKGYSRNDPNQEMARKLDWLLLIFLDYLDYIFQINERNKENCFGTIKERPSSEKEAEANLEKHLDNFFELLDIFQGNLLVTYQSKYVQYIFFYLCSYTEIYPEIMQHFLSRLITNIRTEEETKFVRVNSVHYLRSIMVRAKYIPFQILSKSMGYLIDYLKGYSRISRKKAAKFDPEKESLHFEKIELSASSKYRERLSENSAKQQESEYKQLFQKYDIFYYTAYAVAYIFSNNIEKFVSNNQYEDYNTFVAILLKYNSLFKTLKFVPKNLLSHFKEIHEKLQGTEQLTTLLNAELNMEEEFQESEFRGDVFLEEYLPFDTNFLNMTKKVILPGFHFFENEEEEDKGLMDILGDDNPQDDNKFRNGRVIYDTYDDESDNLSSFSKHETDVSNDNSRSQGNDKVVKRKNVPIKEEPALDKKVKRDSAYQNGHKIKTGA